MARHGWLRALAVAAVGMTLGSIAVVTPAAASGGATAALPIYLNTHYSFEERAADLVKRVESQTDVSFRIRDMYRAALDRDPTPQELDLAYSYLNKATLTQYAQALLATNEVIFWP